jgi:hypothetical protein
MNVCQLDTPAPKDKSIFNNEFRSALQAVRMTFNEK